MNSTPEMLGRIARVRKEGKFQQALELAKQLHKYEPTPAHLELLKEVYLQRGEQLRNQGHTRDAATVFEVASRLDETNPAWLSRLAEELARCGDVQRSMAMMQKVAQQPGAAPVGKEDQLQKNLALLADAAFLQEKGGDDALPPELRADYERVVLAFRQLESGEDDKVRETLQAVSLRSPFMEWKVLIRGFQAYYQKDDQRARDNWSRLDPKRLPVRLAAPLRAAIDPEYLTAQPAATQNALRQQAAQLQGGALGPVLRGLRENLSRPDTLSRGLQQLASHAAVLQAGSPRAFAHLARACYWALLKTGPADIPRYRRVFGAPADDREFHRIEAMGNESGGEMAEAHKHWLAYEKEIANHPETWPGDQGRIARALIWERMGDNAARIPGPEERKKLPRFLRDLEVLPEPLNPGAETCYENSLALAPELLGPHEGLLEHHVRQKQTARAIKAARRLLDRFPENAEALQVLSRILTDEGKFQEALELLEKALRHNPLDRRLRERVAAAHALWARQLVEKSKFEEARPHYQAALNYHEPDMHASVLLRWAAAELKAGDQARGDELLARARTLSPGELYVTYVLLVETSRLAIKGALKTRLTREFNKDIAGTPDPAVAVELVRYAASAKSVGYYGQQTHTKKIIAYALRLDPAKYTEAQFLQLFSALLYLEAGVRTLDRLNSFAHQHYRGNPHFPYRFATYLMGDEPDENVQVWRISNLLDHAQRAALKRPRDEEGITAMLQDIERRRKLLALFNPFLQTMFRMSQRFGDAGFPGGGGAGGFPFPFDPFEMFGGDDDDYDDDE